MLRCAVNRYHAYHDPVCCQHDEVTARGIKVLLKLRRKFCPVSISRKTYSFASASAIAPFLPPFCPMVGAESNDPDMLEHTLQDLNQNLISTLEITPK